MKKILVVFASIFSIIFFGMSCSGGGNKTSDFSEKNKIITPEEEIVQSRIDAYNKQDKESCLSYFADDAKYLNFPSNMIAIDGKEKIEEVICNFNNKQKKITLEIANRIVIGRYVIDSEIIYSGENILTRSFAITEVLNSKIQNIWYIYLSLDNEIPYEQILKKYIEGYNKYKVDNIMSNFSSDTVYMIFPSNDIHLKNFDEIKKHFLDTFKNNPNTHTEIENKIFLEDFIIYLEHITGLEKDIQQVVINELDENLIIGSWIVRSE